VSARARLAIFAVVAGSINVVLLLGPGPLNPTNVDWVFGDNATYYSGWEQYRHDPHLHFPLAWTERVGYPVGTSIALLDSIPLAAVLLRPFSALLPVPFQYLGLWATLCFILQAGFAYSLCRRLSGATTLTCMLGACFFLIAPALTDRADGHTTLLSQWLILAGIDSYFRQPTTPRRWLTPVWLVVALSAAITPYIAAMCFLIALAAIGRLLIERRCGWLEAGVLVAVTVGIVAVTGTTFGALATGDARSYWAEGYGEFSWNLNSLINPMTNGSVLLPPLPLASPRQYEGYSYLGLGMLGMIVLGAAWRPRALGGLMNRSVVPLAALAVVCIALAASSVVTLGGRTLFTVPLPDSILAALGTLRASGRLIWPAYYLIYLGALALVFAIWRGPARIALLSIALAVQFADVMPLRQQVRTACNQRFPTSTTSAVWRGLARSADNLIVLPPMQCQTGDTPGGFYTFVTFGKLAALERMRLNSYYAARAPEAQLQAHCVDLLRAQILGNLDPRSAYVVSEGIRTAWATNGLTSHECTAADGLILCKPAGPGAPPLVAPPARPYALDTTLDFTQSTGNARGYLTFGWGDATPNGTSTYGPVAMIRLGRNAGTSGRALSLVVDGSAFLTASHRHVSIDVVVNGARIETWEYVMGGTGEGVRQAMIPPAVVSTRPGLDIEFLVKNPAAPRFAGGSSFPIYLGLSVRSLVVKETQERP